MATSVTVVSTTNKVENGVTHNQNNHIHMATENVQTAHILSSTMNDTSSLDSNFTLENSTRRNKDTFTLDYDSNLEMSSRSRKQLLQVQSLCYDVDERGMEWWQKLASFKVRETPFFVCRNNNCN